MILELPAADLRAIARIATLTRFNGALQLASGAILAVAWALAFLKLGTIAVTSVVGLSALAACAMGVVFGALRIKMAAAFRASARKPSGDVPALMSAFDRLARLYRMQTWAILGAVAIGVIVGLAAPGR